MTDCSHDRLEPLGEQKTDGGVNSYLRCLTCGSVLVSTPGRNVHVLKPVGHAHN